MVTSILLLLLNDDDDNDDDDDRRNSVLVCLDIRRCHIFGVIPYHLIFACCLFLINFRRVGKHDR